MGLVNIVSLVEREVFSQLVVSGTPAFWVFFQLSRQDFYKGASQSSPRKKERGSFLQSITHLAFGFLTSFFVLSLLFSLCLN